MEVSLPRGVRDYGPNEAHARNRISEKIENVFRLFGFRPLETPAIESIEVLTAKAYGDEGSKEIFVMKDEKSGLRFDLTVPLARYVAMHKELNMPFKRYQISNVWRKEEPQKMRYREFLQADADIIGSDDISADVEVIAAGAMALEGIGLDNYTLLVNSRGILTPLLESFGVKKDDEIGAMRILDKIKKLPRDDIIKMLEPMLDQKKANELLGILSAEGSEQDKIKRIIGAVPILDSETKKILALFDMLRSYRISGTIEFDPSLARGLDYYTGLVWEFVVRSKTGETPSIASGGRYDNLVGLYGKRSIPATGISIGIDRAMDLLELPQTHDGYERKTLVAYLKKEDYTYALNAANALRANGINCDLNVTSRNIQKQLEYANALGFESVVIIGENERNAGMVRIKNLIDGTELTVGLEEAINALKKQ